MEYLFEIKTAALIEIDENGIIIKVYQAGVDFCVEHEVREILQKSRQTILSN